MSKEFFYILFYVFLFFVRVESVRDRNGRVSQQSTVVASSSDNDPPFPFDWPDDADQAIEEQLIDFTDGQLEEQLADASRDDAHVPSSLDHSLIDDFEQLTLPVDSLGSDGDLQLNTHPLRKVAPGKVPSGIVLQNYSSAEQSELMRLYASDRIEDRREFFRFVSERIHWKYLNCASNFVRWMGNPRLDEPIFHRNCVPCANAVDLNLQSFFDACLDLHPLTHYFVSSCAMSDQWISYISHMEYLPVNLRRHPSTTFSDVLRQNVLPNRRSVKAGSTFASSLLLDRYVIQAMVRSSRARADHVFFHALNLIADEFSRLWIIDGQTQRVFHFNDANDVHSLDEIYRPDYVARAHTGIFRPPSLVSPVTILEQKN